MWQNQDGGNGKKGRVSDIREWNQVSANSGALVTWTQGGQQDLYRVGFQGMVDLKVIEPAKGHAVYRDHLPVFTEYLEDSISMVEENLYFNDWY